MGERGIGENEKIAVKLLSSVYFRAVYYFYGGGWAICFLYPGYKDICPAIRLRGIPACLPDWIVLYVMLGRLWNKKEDKAFDYFKYIWNDRGHFNSGQAFFIMDPKIINILCWHIFLTPSRAIPYYDCQEEH